MDARPTARAWIPLAVLTALCLAALANAESPACPVIPLAVRDGRCECVLPTPHADDKFYLLIGSLSRGAGPYPVRIDAGPSAGPASLPLYTRPEDADWSRRVHDLHRRLVDAPGHRLEACAYRPAGDPPRERSFALFVKERDFQRPENYVTVVGVLQAVGKHCQVYVDRDFRDGDGLRPTVEDVVRTFDDEVYPAACRSLGRVLDVDRDGRFTILFTPWLGKLSDGKVSLGGFVRGSDFYRDLGAPYGNRCDMMYLNTDLRPGAHLHTLLAHEYTHAVVFSEHVFGGYLPGVPTQDEEGWLNEALAHVNEDQQGYSWSNLDYRISAFLSDPARYQLVVHDYYGAGLWRSHGNRGATYLFLRWCADRYGPDLPGLLTRTSLNGTANLETATEERFADLFRRWSVALALSGSGMTADGIAPATRIDLHGPLAGRLLCGPRFDEVDLSNGRCEVKLAGTAVAPVLLHSAKGGFSRVTVRAPADADLQVTLVRLPAATGRLGVECRADTDGRSLRLLLTAYDADLRLDGAAWERAVPQGSRPGDTSFQAEGDTGRTVTAWFGAPFLRAGETRCGNPIALPALAGPKDELVFKIAATDQGGHRVTGWARLGLAGADGGDQAGKTGSRGTP